MKEQINLFGEDFEKTRMECLKEEREIRIYQEKLAILTRKLREKNKERASKINEIRKNKIKEIDEELIKTNVKLENTKKLEELDSLKQEIEYLKYLKEKLCEFFGHEAILNSNGWKCSCCGKTISFIEVCNVTTKYMNIIDANQPNDNNNKIRFTDFLIPNPMDADSILPSFESYQQELRKNNK